MESSLVWVGRVVKTHGIKGQIKVFSPGGSGAALQKGNLLLLENSKGERIPRVVESCRGQGSLFTLALEGVKRKEEAQDLVGSGVFVAPEGLAALPVDEFYHYQLLGLEVRTEEGVPLGILEGILPTGSNDVFVVRKEGREILIPATEEVVVKVDLSQKILVIRLLEGLLPENDL